jgi:hypothetical protein
MKLSGCGSDDVPDFRRHAIRPVSGLPEKRLRRRADHGSGYQFIGKMAK